MFERIALIGIGLIGSSISHAHAPHGSRAGRSSARRATPARRSTRRKQLGLIEQGFADAARGGRGRRPRHPVRAGRRLRGARGRDRAASLKPGAILTDVGSVKAAVVRDVAPHVPKGVHFVPGPSDRRHRAVGAGGGLRRAVRRPLVHPDAGARTRTRRGREAHGVLEGARLQGRDHERPSTTTWCSRITSHLPHLIAYNIVNTAAHLERVTDSEVIKFSAGGFRDFTRIAASDPTMWRDVFLNNKEAVLEMLRPLLRGPADAAARHPLRRRRHAVPAVRGGARHPPRHHPGRAGYGGARLRACAREPARRRPRGRSRSRAWRDRARPLGVRLRLADVAAGVSRSPRRATPASSAGTAPSASTRVTTAARRAGRAWCSGSTAAASARAWRSGCRPENAAETLRYLRRARADLRRLSRGARAGRRSSTRRARRR